MIVCGAAASGVLMAGTASAHVTANVYGEQPAKGGYGAIVLRVPNEEADAGTIKLEVNLKPEYGITSGRAKPVPGWTLDIAKTTLPTPVKNGKGTEVTDVITKMSWTAQPGTKIAAGSTEFQEFEISVGPMPNNVDSLLLPASQTYDNGKVVNWDQPSDGNAEPEHPAPVVKLAAASNRHGHGHGTGQTGQSNGTGSGSHDTQATAASTDDTARWLGGAGLVVGALALGFGLGAMLRSRRPTPQPAAQTAHTTDGTHTAQTKETE